MKIKVIFPAKTYSVLNNRLPNNTQITTNNVSGLLCRSRPLRFIEDQLSLKNRIVKNSSQNTPRKINGVLDTYLQKRLGGQEKTLQKNPRETGKNRGNLGRNQAQKTPRPSYEAEKIKIINENIYIIYIDEFIERRSNFNSRLSAIFEINQLIQINPNYIKDLTYTQKRKRNDRE